MSEKYLLSLDASTSGVGISVFTYQGELMYVSHFKPKAKKGAEGYYKLLEKVHSITDFLNHIPVQKQQIKEVVIEEPLISSTNINTATMLNFYQGILFGELNKFFNEDTTINYISVNESRKIVLKEFVDKKKKTLWTPIPPKVMGIKKSQLKKLLVLISIGKRFPEIKWDLNRNKRLSTENYDKADSVVVGLSYLILNKYIESSEIELDEIMNVLMEYLEYEAWSKNIKGSIKEQKLLKKYYVEKLTKLNEKINFDIFI